MKYLLKQDYLVNFLCENVAASKIFQESVNQSLSTDNKTRMSALLLSTLSENPLIMRNFGEEGWRNIIDKLMEVTSLENIDNLSKILKY